MNTIIFTVVILSSLGVLLAVILYFVAQKFKVFEDPRIDAVVEMLPGANCGGCGYTGCRAFADALVTNDDISALQCPVGGSNVMNKAAEYLGKTAVAKDTLVAVVRCAGSCEVRPRTNLFDGAQSCLVMASTYAGNTDCRFGCLGQGDCVVSCNFDAIHINPETLMPEVDDEKCTSCGSCVKACPKFIIELRKKGAKNRRIYVSCVNQDDEGLARKSCDAACTGCAKCLKICPFDSIIVNNNLAYIDNTKCRLCRKCATVCSSGAIKELNFPPRKQEVNK
jgi:Na+-translocating ferredoxin:NAD+ oxidoreductase RNF subunit RnfB